MSDDANDDGPHVYATLEGAIGKSHIAAAFEAAGWIVRRCAWTDYELIRAHDRLVLEAEGPWLLHGPVSGTPDGIDDIQRVLREVGVRYRVELYSADDELLQTFSSDED